MKKRLISIIPLILVLAVLLVASYGFLTEAIGSNSSTDSNTTSEEPVAEATSSSNDTTVTTTPEESATAVTLPVPTNTPTATEIATAALAPTANASQTAAAVETAARGTAEGAATEAAAIEAEATRRAEVLAEAGTSTASAGATAAAEMAETATTSAIVKTETARPTPSPTPEAVVVSANGLNLRSGPGIAYDPPIGYLREGVPLTILGRNDGGDWLKVVVEPGVEGWVSGASELVQVNVPNVNEMPVLRVDPPPPPVEAEDAGEPAAPEIVDDNPPMYEYGPKLLTPKAFETVSVDGFVTFSWQPVATSLGPNQYYSLLIVRDDLDKKDACFHFQFREPETIIVPSQHNCTPGTYYWTVGIATDVSGGAGAERIWRRDSEQDEKNHIGIGIPHPNRPSSGGGNTDSNDPGEGKFDP